MGRFDNYLWGFLMLGLIVGLVSVAPQVGRAEPGGHGLVPDSGEQFVFESVPSGTTLGHSYIPNTFEVWMEGIGAAEELIQIGAFYFQDRERGRTRLTELLEKLVERSRTGVRVEILTDSAIATPPEYLAAEENIEVRFASYQQHTDGVMHAKYLIIDGEKIYVGSANLDWRSLEHIREIGLAANDSEVAGQLQTLFEIDWELAAVDEANFWEEYSPLREPVDYQQLMGEGFSMPEGRELILTATPYRTTPSGIELADEVIIRMINSAERRLFIDLYNYDKWDYYSGNYWDEIDRAIRRAEARGVDIYMLFPDWALSRTTAAYLKGLAVLDNVEIRIISIPHCELLGYVPFSRTSHPKLLIVDSKFAWLGSTNWSYNYFTATRDIDVVTANDQAIQDLQSFFITGFQSEYSETLRLEESYRVPLR